jgi:hypothetical protein
MMSVHFLTAKMKGRPGGRPLSESTENQKAKRKASWISRAG